MTEFDEFRGHEITVTTLTGSGGRGDTYATPVTYAPATSDGVLVADKRRLVRSPDGAEVISETTIYDPEPAHAPAYAPGSKVLLPSGRTATVITASTYTDTGAGLPESVEVACT